MLARSQVRRWGLGAVLSGAVAVWVVASGADEPPTALLPELPPVPIPAPALPAPALPVIPVPTTPFQAAPKPVTPVQAAPDTEGTGEVAIITRLRKQFGDPLANTTLGATSDSDFAQAVSDVSSTARPAIPVPVPVSPSKVLVPEQSPWAVTSAPLTVEARPAITAADVSSLRDSARQLERTAATLEDLGRYADADGLRELAARLRAAAREVDATASHTARTVVRQALRQTE